MVVDSNGRCNGLVVAMVLVTVAVVVLTVRKAATVNWYLKDVPCRFVVCSTPISFFKPTLSFFLLYLLILLRYFFHSLSSLCSLLNPPVNPLPQPPLRLSPVSNKTCSKRNSSSLHISLKAAPTARYSSAEKQSSLSPNSSFYHIIWRVSN